MLFIGIDLGTSACKFLLVDEQGTVKSVVSEAYEVEYPQPGWSQQNPAAWLDAVRRGIPRLLDGQDVSEVCAIGCGGQMHGLVALDAHNDVIRPAILWNDGRTSAEVSYLNETIGTEKILSYTGNIAFAGFTAPKLLWVRKHEPENFKRIAHVMLPKDYVNFWLTGAYVSDPSDASGTLLFDAAHRTWSEEMLEICGLQKSWLPQVYESYQPVGTLRAEVAQELGLPTHTVVAAGAGDNAAAALGCGVIGPGTMNVSLGTSGTVFIPTDTFVSGVGDKIHSFCHADGKWHLMGCILSAASCNAWWAQDILHTKDIAAEQVSICRENVQKDQPFFLPYLMGERTPHNDTSARGAFMGLSMSTSRSDMTRAVLEGVAFAVRDSVEIARSMGVNPSTSMVCGGGARSDIWLEMLADILDVSLVRPATEQGPGMGGAMLGAIAAGVFTSPEACAQAMVTGEQTSFQPKQELYERYNERYKLWRDLYPALSPICKTMIQ